MSEQKSGRSFPVIFVLIVSFVLMLAVAGYSRRRESAMNSQLVTSAVMALSEKPVRIEDLARIELILERGESDFREMLLRRGLTREQIDGFRYGRYKLFRDEE